MPSSRSLIPDFGHFCYRLFLAPLPVWASLPLRIYFEYQRTPTTSESLNWWGTWRAAIATIADLIRSVRGRLAYNESPVSRAAGGTARLPHNDRQWLALDVSHRFDIAMDVGDAYLFAGNTMVTRKGSTDNFAQRPLCLTRGHIERAPPNYPID